FICLICPVPEATGRNTMIIVVQVIFTFGSTSCNHSAAPGAAEKTSERKIFIRQQFCVRSGAAFFTIQNILYLIKKSLRYYRFMLPLYKAGFFIFMLRNKDFATVYRIPY